MKLSDLLDDRVIRVNLRARDQKGSLEEMVGILKRAGKIDDPGIILKALFDREASGSRIFKE